MLWQRASFPRSLIFYSPETKMRWILRWVQSCMNRKAAHCEKTTSLKTNTLTNWCVCNVDSILTSLTWKVVSLTCFIHWHTGCHMLLYASITIVIKIRNFVREKIYKWGVSTPFYIHHSEMLKLEIVHFNLIKSHLRAVLLKFWVALVMMYSVLLNFDFVAKLTV